MNTDHRSDLVELNVSAYVDQAAALLGLALAGEHRPGVIANVTQLRAIAGPLMDFSLADTLESAPVFEP